MKFRGMKVHLRNEYPSVYLPEHPTAYKDGMTYVHRLVAYENFGRKVLNMHVHHKDEDKTNWAITNLELLTPSEHAVLHTKTTPVIRTCGYCGEEIEVTSTRRKQRNSVYCNPTCTAKGRSKVEWPSREELESMLSTMSREAVGRELGVSGNAVKKHYARIV